MRRPRVLLDANVLVDAQVRDLFLRLAEADLIEVRWSKPIVEEVRRALTERLGLPPAKVDHLCDVLHRAFPHAAVAGFDSLVDRFDLPDADDCHVVAAAVHGECDLLVTYNDEHFPDAAAEPFDLLAVSVEDALVLFAGWFQTRLVDVVERQIAALRRPAMSPEAFLERLALRAPRGAIAIGAALGIEQYTKIFSEMLDAERPDSPQGAVQQLLAALDGGDVEGVAAVVDAELAAHLTDVPDPTPNQVSATLRQALDDVFTTEGWGFATARRVHAPNVELVKLVRAGPDPRIAFVPQQAQGHLFYMRVRGSRWVVVGLDGPDPTLDDEFSAPE